MWWTEQIRLMNILSTDTVFYTVTISNRDRKEIIRINNLRIDKLHKNAPFVLVFHFISTNTSFIVPIFILNLYVVMFSQNIHACQRENYVNL